MKKGLKNFKTTYSLIAAGYLILGGILLFYPETSMLNISYAFGVITIVYGVVHLITYFMKNYLEAVFRYDLVVGIVAVILGMIILIKPSAVMTMMPILIGVFIILSAIVKIQNALDLKRMEFGKWWIVLIFSVVSAVLGVVLLMNPFTEDKVLTLFMGSGLVADGVFSLCSMVWLAWFLRKIKKQTEKALAENAADDTENTTGDYNENGQAPNVEVSPQAGSQIDAAAEAKQDGDGIC